ncbi:MAG: MFS transporter [Chloroflexi bacterium]|nr:MFS transporter [Chloroflexota bacterium]
MNETKRESGLRSALPSVLRHRDFRLFFGGQAISLTGTWMQMLAQSWVVMGLTSSALALGAINFAVSLPMLLFTLLGGVAADRWDKRRILLVAQSALMICAFILGTIVALGELQIWHVVAVAVLVGLATAYELPATQSLVPELVERHEISQAIALNQAVFHGSRLIGPALAGGFIAAFGATSAFFANGLSFVAVLVSLLLIKSRPRRPGLVPASQLSALREGLAYVWQSPRLRTLMGLTSLITLFVFPNLVVLMPLYAQDVLGLDAAAMGLLMAASGFGSLVASIGMLRVATEQRGLRIAQGAAASGLALGLLAVAPSVWMAAPTVWVLSFGLSLAMGLTATIIQQSVPDALRGRVMSVHTMMFVGVMPFATLGISGLSDLIGQTNQLGLSAVLFSFGALALWRLDAAAHSETTTVAAPDLAEAV